MKIDINGVSITLTTEQLAEIAKQTSKIKTYKDIKSFEGACEYLNISIKLPDFTGLDSEEMKRYIALYKLTKIVKAINSLSGFVIDWNDSTQKKHYPYFDMRGTVSFSYTGYYWYITNTGVFSPLYLKTSDEAKYMGETFIDLYRDYLK